MSKPVFNNKPNPQVWISRAVAVTSVVIVFGVDKSPLVLTVQRSKDMPDEPLKWAAPSGYLDWNETSYDAMLRETFEETSLYLPNLSHYLKYNNEGQPYYINTDPTKDAKQNVSLHYVHVYDFTDENESFPDMVKDFTCFETKKVEWLKMTDLINIKKDWAFRHDELILGAMKNFHSRYKFDIK